MCSKINIFRFIAGNRLNIGYKLACRNLLLKFDLVMSPEGIYLFSHIFSHKLMCNIFFISPVSGNNIVPEFIVRLCMDVLLEVLGFGNRRRLIKMERIGQRYHQMIEQFFNKAPFIRISPCFKAYGLVFWPNFIRPSFESFFIMPYELNACLRVRVFFVS